MLIQPHSSTLTYILSMVESNYSWDQISNALWQVEPEPERRSEWRVHIHAGNNVVKQFHPKPLSPFMLQVQKSLTEYFVEEVYPVYSSMDMKYIPAWFLTRYPRIEAVEYEIKGITYMKWDDKDERITIELSKGTAGFFNLTDGQYSTSLTKEKQ